MSGRSGRVRFAPSPTGTLHLGNARTALFNWLIARRGGGTLVLRIEDTDRDRHVEGAEGVIFEDLRWLGIDWDEGPDVGGPHGPYRQSERGELYREAAARLEERGLVYRCFCGETEGQGSSRRGDLPSKCPCASLGTEPSTRRLEGGESAAWRFRSDSVAGMGDEIVFEDRVHGEVRFELAQIADPVILRSDGRPTYNFAVVVDDAAMGIDLVIRGDDHLSNTPRQLLLYRGLEVEPPAFAHLPMVRGEDGSRLSKRHGAVSVAEYRRLGYPSEALVNSLALLGWAPDGERTILSESELLEAFSIERVRKSAATFDPAKLEWISNQWFQKMESGSAKYVEALERALRDEGLLSGPESPEVTAWVAEILEMLRPSLIRIGQAVERAAGLFAKGGEPADEAGRELLRGESSRLVLERLVGLLEEGEPREREDWKGLAKRIAKETGIKGKQLFPVLRLALTGRMSGPEMDRVVPLISMGAALGLDPGCVPPAIDRARRTLESIP